MIFGSDNTNDQKLYRGAHYLKQVQTEDETTLGSVDTGAYWIASWFHIDGIYSGSTANFTQRLCNNNQTVVSGTYMDTIRLYVEPFYSISTISKVNLFTQAYGEIGGAWELVFVILSKILFFLVTSAQIIYFFVTRVKKTKRDDNSIASVPSERDSDQISKQGTENRTVVKTKPDDPLES